MSSLTLQQFNQLAVAKAGPLLFQCCGADNWVDQMMENRPFTSIEDLLDKSTATWVSLVKHDWLQAFQQHPQIGDLSTLKKKFSTTAAFAKSEQASTSLADESLLKELADYNQRYFENFGFIFITCATGRSANEMLNSLKVRIENSPEVEIRNAADEQNKITNLRLKKLIK